MKYGRPRKYETPEQMQEIIEEYSETDDLSMIRKCQP